MTVLIAETANEGALAPQHDAPVHPIDPLVHHAELVSNFMTYSQSPRGN